MSKSHSNSAKAWAIILLELSIGATGIYLATSESWGWYLLGIFILALSMLQWFVISHDLAHFTFFKERSLNITFGFVSAFFTLLPFYSWRYLHMLHHTWSGYKDVDPTQPDMSKMKPVQLKIINFCWKYWVPVFAIAFAASNFWNVKRLKELELKPGKIRKAIFSMLLIVIVHLSLILIFGKIYASIFLPAYFIFLSLSDLILISQHSHIDHQHAHGEKVKPIASVEQNIYSRTLVFPQWIENYVLLKFNQHAFHHQYPTIPLYALKEGNPKGPHAINALNWIHIAKGIPAEKLIFKSSRDTGIQFVSA